MNNCIECGNEYELHSTDGARCPKNQGQLVNGKLEFFATHYESGMSELATLRAEIARLREDARLADMAWKDNQSALKAQADKIIQLRGSLIGMAAIYHEAKNHSGNTNECEILVCRTVRNMTNGG